MKRLSIVIISPIKERFASHDQASWYARLIRHSIYDDPELILWVRNGVQFWAIPTGVHDLVIVISSGT
jgi:hypothetical protein